jgi:hypothetical protein
MRMRPPRTVARPVRAAWTVGVIVGVIALGGCRGENLFSLAASVAQPGPTVNMTQPGPGFTVAVGDSLRVQAEVTAGAGLTAITYRATYATSDSDAFGPESQAYAGEPFARVDNWLQPGASQVAGDLYVVVQATDRTGAVGVDSVKVQIVN